MVILAQDQGLNDLRVRAGFKQYATGSHAPESLTTLEWCCYLQKQCYDPECGQRPSVSHRLQLHRAPRQSDTLLQGYAGTVYNSDTVW